MTVLTSKADIEKLRASGKIIKQIFSWLEENVRAGVSTEELDREIEKIIVGGGGEPAFKGYKGYPAAICASVNEVVVHGIPSDRIILKDGDIVGVDVGVRKDGFYTDAARTYPVGTISAEARRLMDVTRECLEEGVKKAIAGNRVSDISHAIESVARRESLEEVRTFVGHGIGRNLHEAPEVPNWGEPGKGPVLEEGLLLAIEPMINAGTRKIDVLEDGWTAVTKDGKLSAHFENTVMVGRERSEIIT
ncbi:MAG: type I methionyl aminopeptidase [Candidatus Omnitrophica bacterium]|nr:type I methionyl aminopeptidase [Candidatus Omnitrophota bacterium]